MATQKKAWLSAIATFVLIAVIGVTFAFKPAKTDSKHFVTYYWYNVNDSGEIVSGSQAFGGAQKDRSQAEAALPCPAGSDADCIRGFLSPISSFPTEATGDTPALKKEL